MSTELASAVSSQEVLTSEGAVALWLRFQCNPSATLHDSYREGLAYEIASLRRERNKKASEKTDKKEGEQEGDDSPWLQQLWRNPLLSRHVCERFALRCDAWPHAPSELSFFLRLVMIDAEALQRLFCCVGLVLSAHEIAAVIESDALARLKKGLGDEDYLFAMTTGARLRPAQQRIALGLSKRHREHLNDPAFHTAIGLRLLLLSGEGSLSEQHWRRLSLKCPRGIVEMLRSDKRKTHGVQGIGEGMDAGIDAGTAAGLQVRLAVFETGEGEDSSLEEMWCSVAKEVIGSWHAWLESSKVA